MSVQSLQVDQALGLESRWDLSLSATEKLKDCFVRSPEWHQVEEMSFEQASELLDFLENQRIDSREVQMQTNGLLTVRWLS